MSDDEDPLSRALGAHRAVRRRRVIRALGGAVALGVVGAAGTVAYLEAKKHSGRREAPARASAALAAALAGSFGVAKKLAAEARELDPRSIEARVAYLRVHALDLVDGDGDASASVGLLSEARNLGCRGVEMALVSLAAAIGIKNDHLVEKVLKEPRDEDLTADGLYALVAGAGYDLIADPSAVEWYEQAVALLKDPFLAVVRLVRALVFVGELDRAEKSLALVPDEKKLERAVLVNLVARARALGGGSPGRLPQIDRARIEELPRSLRVLATGLSLEDPDAPWGQSAGLDAALDDLDTPLAAVIAGRIALLGGDRASARTASQAALRMRDELDQARSLGARVALADGDLPAARSLVGDGPDKELVAALQGIDAYEACDAKKLRDADEAQRGSPSRWKLLDAALATGLPKHAYPERCTGETAPAAGSSAATPESLDPLVKHGEPWADLIAVDAALEQSNAARAKKIVAGWSNTPLTPPQKARKEAAQRAK